MGLKGPEGGYFAPRVPVKAWVRAKREPHAQRKYGPAKWHRATAQNANGQVVETLCGRAIAYGERLDDRPHENRFCAECMRRWTEGGGDAAGVA